MRVYAVFRLDPFLGAAAWGGILASFLRQPFATAIQSSAQGPHDHWTINRQSTVYGHLMLGDVELEHGAVWSALDAQAGTYGIAGTTEEKIAGVIDYEFSAALVAAGYTTELGGVLWTGIDELYAAIVSAHDWLLANADLFSGRALDGWTKPTRDAQYVGAQYVQVGATQYTVTTLGDAGKGSLREALEATGERSIHFAVAGNILFQKTIIPGSGFVVDGSDSPGGGVCFQNAAEFNGVQVDVKAADGGHIKHIRFRPGLPLAGYNDFCKGLIVREGSKNILVDHCSFSWGTDGVAGVGGSNVTFSYCIFSEGLQSTAQSTHGVLVQESAGLVAFDHCLFAHFGARTPKLDTNSDVQMINCVVYNCISQTVFGGKSYPAFQRADLIGNTWVSGPNTPPDKYGVEHWGWRLGSLLLYAADNDGPHPMPEQYQSIFPTKDWPFIFFETKPLTIPDRLPTSRVDAYLEVLADAGATLPRRDAADARIVNDVINGTGAIITSQELVGGWPDLTAK